MNAPLQDQPPCASAMPLTDAELDVLFEQCRRPRSPLWTTQEREDFAAEARRVRRRERAIDAALVLLVFVFLAGGYLWGLNS